jgi:hypothetical protein
MLFHCVQLLNSGWSAIPVKCVIVEFSFYSQWFMDIISNTFCKCAATFRTHCMPSLDQVCARVKCSFVEEECRFAVLVRTVHSGKSGQKFCIRNPVPTAASKTGTRWCTQFRHYTRNQQVTGSIPDGVFGIFHWHNPSTCTMALGLTQPLTELSTRSNSWEVKVAGA